MTVTANVGAAISATGVRKDFGDRRVLHNLDLQVGWGEIAALFGANGAGKTTLLRILAGLTRPDDGQLHIGNRRVHRGGNAARRLIGFVGHESLLYNDLTCRENLLFYGQLYGIANIDLRIQQVLEQVGLADRRNRRVRTLSHGMQKRLSVARAILHEPTVLLMDEPESGLDQASTETLGRLLGDWAAAGKSVLLTTHSEQLGLAWAHRVLGLSGGRLAYDASADRTTADGLQKALQSRPRPARMLRPE